jgi:hypothetical protein
MIIRIYNIRENTFRIEVIINIKIKIKNKDKKIESEAQNHKK